MALDNSHIDDLSSAIGEHKAQLEANKRKLKMLLGQTVLYRVTRSSARVAIIVDISCDPLEVGVATLYVLPIAPGRSASVDAGVPHGFGLGQWHALDEVPADMYGVPDYAAMESRS